MHFIPVYLKIASGAKEIQIAIENETNDVQYKMCAIADKHCNKHRGNFVLRRSRSPRSRAILLLTVQ